MFLLKVMRDDDIIVEYLAFCLVIFWFIMSTIVMPSTTTTVIIIGLVALVMVLKYQSDMYIPELENVDDAYSVLGVSPSASKDEIRRAFKQLTLQWHPDRNRAAQAHDMFIKIRHAYESMIYILFEYYRNSGNRREC